MEGAWALPCRSPQFGLTVKGRDLERPGALELGLDGWQQVEHAVAPLLPDVGVRLLAVVAVPGRDGADDVLRVVAGMGGSGEHPAFGEHSAFYELGLKLTGVGFSSSRSVALTSRTRVSLFIGARVAVISNTSSWVMYLPPPSRAFAPPSGIR